MTKTVQYQNELHKFLIWDTAGQERVSRVLHISLITCFHQTCGGGSGRVWGAFQPHP